MNRQVETYSNRNTKEMVRLGLFFALVFIQTWVPFLGNINTPLLSITIVHVTVIVATLWLGTKSGFFIGTFWGINSWLRALIMPSSPLQTLVLSSPIVSVIPRMVMPLIIGGIYQILPASIQKSKLLQMLLGALGSILNTVILLSFIGLFKSAAGIGALNVTDTSALWKVLGTIVVTNGIPEFIFSGLVTPPILTAVKLGSKRK